MAFLREDTRVAEAVFREPALLNILDRFGIYIGVGDDTFAEACRKTGEDTQFILAIINTYLNEDYFPEDLVCSFPLSRIIGYLQKTDDYYRDILLPNIDRHFTSLIRISGEDNNLHLLRGLADEMRTRLIERIDNDSKFFPSILSDSGKSSEKFSSDDLRELDEAIEDTLADLLSFFIVHLRGEYNRNLCLAVVTALFTLERDVRQNNRIRRRILGPILASRI